MLAHVRDRFACATTPRSRSRRTPTRWTIAKLDGLLAAGFDRLSMGAQSFDRGVLAALERVHSPDSVRRAFVAARAAGYENVNLDLIYGADGEGLDSWERTLRADDRPGARARQRVRADDRAGDGARSQGVGGRRCPRPIPTCRPTCSRPRATCCAVAGYQPLRGLELGEARVRVPPQPGVLGAPRLRRPGRRRALVPRRPSLVERPPAGGVHGAGRGGGSCRPAATSVWSRRTPTSKRCSCGCGSCEGIPSSWVDADRALPFLESGCCRRTTARSCRRSAACCC